MLTKNQIKHINALHLKKYRQETRLFLVEGEKLVDELLNSSLKIQLLVATDEWKHPSKAADVIIDSSLLEKISTLQTPNKVLAIVEQPKFEADFSKLSLYLYLDNIKDPGNLGTIIRTAEWFGLSHIFLSPECVEYYNPKVVQSSMGSIFRMQLTNISLPDLQREVQPKATYGAVLGGNVVEGKHWETPCILVIGSESHGIGTENKKHLTEGISISAYGQAESLNAAIACGILLYSFKQQPG